MSLEYAKKHPLGHVSFVFSKHLGASLVAWMVKSLQCRRRGFDRWVRKILEKGTATQSSILAWRIPCTEKPGRLQSMGSQGVVTLSHTTKLLLFS